MPRIDVLMSDHSQAHRRRVAVAITSVFAEEGMSPEHVLTVFMPIQHTSVYAGRESLDEVLGKRDFGVIRVYISTRRGQEFRDKFVRTVVRVFEGLGVDPSNLSIDFVPREAVDAYIGTVLMGATRIPRGAVTAPSEPTADEKSVPPSTAAPSANAKSVEDDVRELLGRFWGPHLQDAAADSTLLSLVPNPVAWNSLAKAEVATNLESWLGLPFNTLDVGTERVKAMFGDTVTLGGLVATLRAMGGRAA